MAWNGTGSSWQYSRWVRNAARNARITEPTGLEEALYRVIVAFFYNPATGNGTRPWLKEEFFKKAVAGATGSTYRCNLATEPTHVIVELLDVIGRDLKKIGLTDVEYAALRIAGWIQEFVVGYRRRLGTQPVYGGTSGSIVDVP